MNPIHIEHPVLYNECIGGKNLNFSFPSSNFHSKKFFFYLKKNCRWIIFYSLNFHYFMLNADSLLFLMKPRGHEMNTQKYRHYKNTLEKYHGQKKICLIIYRPHIQKSYKNIKYKTLNSNFPSLFCQEHFHFHGFA